MIKVLLIHDQALIREGMRILLSAHPRMKVLAALSEINFAMQLLRTSSDNNVALPDAVLLFVNHLAQTRRILDAIATLLILYPTLKIIVVLPNFRYPYPLFYFQAGVLGCLSMRNEMEEVMEAIEKVHQGQSYVGAEVAQEIAFKSVTAPGDLKMAFDLLSERELQILQSMISGMKIQEIAKKLSLSDKTVNSYRYRVLEKLKVESDAEMMHVVLLHALLNPEYSKIILSHSRFIQVAKDLSIAEEMDAVE